MFDQPCPRGHLPLNPETLTIGNKPVTISGDPSKQPNEHKNKVEEHFNNNNPRSMWQGINNITGFKGNKPATVNIAASLPDELNTFYARFEADNTAHTESAQTAAAEEVSPLTLSVADVTRSFKRVNIRKAVGPDGIPCRVLKACAFQLAGVFTDIFNLSLSLSVVPSCFQKSTIVPIPKKKKITCLNDWSPVALTPIFSKCFEKLVREHICSVLPASLDPLQFAYRSNRSTDDAIAFTLHTALSHLENKNTYVRMLFVDYSSAFNTIVPATLVAKLQTLGLNRSLCSWILAFWQAEVRWSEWATTHHLPWSSTLVHRRVASSAHSCTPCTHTTVQLHTARMSSSNLLMTQWW